MAERTLKIKNYKEFQRAVAKATPELKKDVRGHFKRMAEPVRQDAERLALGEIRNVGSRWSQMRIGVTKNVVYVAPKQRGRGTPAPLRRKNLAGLLMDRAMQPALDENASRVLNEFEKAVDELVDDWNRFGR